MLSATGVSSLDMVLLVAPFAIFMILAMLGLDKDFARDKDRGSRRPRFCEVGQDGRGLVTDPHGSSRKGTGARRGKRRGEEEAKT